MITAAWLEQNKVSCSQKLDITTNQKFHFRVSIEIKLTSELINVSHTDARTETLTKPLHTFPIKFHYCDVLM